MAGRQRAPAGDQPRRLGTGAALERQMALEHRHARRDPAERRHDHAVAEPPQQPPEAAPHLAIARRDLAVRRLQRRVQQHAHGWSSLIRTARAARS
jgi:hypothetical protein